MGFSGFDRDLLAFYTELRTHNTKEWWTANKLRYEQHVREEEQIRIAREVHDELGQSLTGLKLQLIWLASRLPKQSKLLHAPRALPAPE